MNVPPKPAGHVRRVPCPTCRPGKSCKKHCGAATRQIPGGLCKRAKGQGTTHPGIGRCDRHGGATRSHVAAANVEKARLVVTALALPTAIAPHDALIQLMGLRWGAVLFLNDVIAEMELVAELKQRNPDGFEKPAVWYQMRDDALAAAEHIAKTCHDVGIEERRVALAEDHGREVADLLRNVVADLVAEMSGAGVPAEVSARFQREVVPRIVALRLRQLMGGDEAAGSAA